jgi:prevent-host-death family protein
MIVHNKDPTLSYPWENMKLSKSVKPISYLKAHASEIFNHLNEDRETLIITQNGEAKAALVDIHEYEQMMESLAMLKMIAQSKKSIQELISK